MAQVINTNIASLNAQRNLNGSQSTINTALQRLSTGLRINSAKDDAAGLAISERMSTQINGLNQAVRNANDGISLAQTAEGALSQIGTNLQRIRELAVQSRNATNSSDDRAALQKEVAQLTAEIGRVAKDTGFNGTKLLDGSFTQQAFQVGADQGQTITIDKIANANVDSLGTWKGLATSASVAGATPSGGTTTAPTNGSGTLTDDALTSNASYVESTTTAGDYTATFAASKITINGVELSIGAVSGSEETGTDDALASAKEAYITAVGTAINNAGFSGLTVTDDGAGGLTFANSSKTEFKISGENIVGTHTVGAHQPAKTTYDATGHGDILINGVAIDSVGKTTNTATRLNDLAAAINDRTAEHNVTATVDNGRLVLSSKTGDFTIAAGTGSTAANTLLSAGLTDGFDSSASDDTKYVAGETKTGFADLDISTVDGADNAILAMDAALKSVNEARANLGAVQNRFGSVVSNLETTSENLSASRSRIRDADFASETASLTRAQILQQAGTAMLAQANSLPNNVLSLLRG
ncbi:Flagellin [Pigmentiphaga humi]|uniref:Flagellin n=1 Tax=Pigmentiphaga humi TaxID=2478468 RepID=A0A3P4B0U3_9BURK|nr:flagellin [Pigmentiphaga humi]VCU69923.1 Flagellin [Pigmentiphaga humi]